MRQTALILTLLFVAASGMSAEKKWIHEDPEKICALVKDKVLCADLLAIRDRDQIPRYDALNHPDDKNLEAVIRKVELENLERIDVIIRKHGWPGTSLVGEKGSGSAWVVIQHADLATKKKYLPVMVKAADAGELSWALLATTIDRIQVQEGKPQTYGTQFHQVNGELVPEQIEDESHVDERRKKVGLQTLAEYTAQMKEMYARPANPK
jgi:hypothetical protein